MVKYFINNITFYMVYLLKNNHLLFFLSYGKDKSYQYALPSGFEPEAHCLEGSCSIQLS